MKRWRIQEIATSSTQNHAAGDHGGGLHPRVAALGRRYAAMTEQPLAGRQSPRGGSGCFDSTQLEHLPQPVFDRGEIGV